MFNGEGPPIVPSEPGITPVMPNNPADEDRYELLKLALDRGNRLEDFDNIIKLLSPPPEITSIAPPGYFKGKKVGIIGGGAAGLAAAFELRKLGFDITVFEANEDRIGGRVYTYYFDKNRRYYGELGAMRIPVSHETTWHYINLFEMPTRPFIQSNENGFIYAHHTRVRNDIEGKNVMREIYPKYNLTKLEREAPWQILLDRALEAPLLNMSPDIRREILEVKRIYNPLILYWDRFSIRQVLEHYGLSQDAINLVGSLSPLVGSFFYINYHEILQEIYPFDFTYLYEIVGGLARLPVAIYNSLVDPNPKQYGNIPKECLGKVTWKQGTWVSGIYKSDKNNKVILKFKNKYIKSCESEDFDYVVSAIPFSTLRNIEIKPYFTNRKMEAIRELNYVTAQKTLLLCKERFWEKGGPNERIIGGGSFTDLPISSIWYPSDHAQEKYYSPEEPGVLLASYNFSLDAIRLSNQPGNLTIKDVMRQVEEVHGLPPGYLDSIVVDYVTLNWNLAPWSLGGFCYLYPEQKRLFSYSITIPEYNQRVFFAGEHISMTHGWQNGAYKTGMETANDIAKVALVQK